MYACIHTDTGHEDITMRDALVHLAAVIVSSPSMESTNLWFHLFDPVKLKGSHIPGFCV